MVNLVGHDNNVRDLGVYIMLTMLMHQKSYLVFIDDSNVSIGHTVSMLA